MAPNGKQPKQDPASKSGPGSQGAEDARRGDSSRDTDLDIDVDSDPEDMDPSDRTPSGEEAGDED